MSRQAVPIEIFERAEFVMDNELRKRQLPGHFKLRMQIVKMSKSHALNKDIASSLNCGVSTVRRWRKRWHEHYAGLVEYEKGHDGQPVTEKELLDKIKDIISDDQRAGAPCRISESEINRLVALACEEPEKFGAPFTHWTHERLSVQAAKMGIQVSAAHVGRLLKKRVTSSQK
jgi:putative transposase